ncbi:MAG TPA: 2-hydroxyglutaryl-CoA dehydratase [Firmicutes bacterium]|nr:2-hydroxyglutaryl-CoA dehydratase [Bacillota bacterium]
MLKLHAGIDAGSVATKAVIIEEDFPGTPESRPRILTKALVPTGADPVGAAEKALSQVLSQCGLRREQLASIGGTGYGRIRLSGVDRVITEITCHAYGVHWLFPAARTVIDVGGQDIKVIRTNELGQVEDFVMNDKCAAGTGRFLEVMANALGMDLEQLARVDLDGKAAPISSTCTVFAESEVISLVASGTPTLEIIRGLFNSVAERIQGMAARLIIEPEVAMTGGVSAIRGIPQAIERHLGLQVHVPELAQFAGAFGAALLSRK